MLLFDETTQTFREAQQGEIESTIGFAIGFQKQILHDDHKELLLNRCERNLMRNTGILNHCHTF
jgi:hypothetical protein